MLKLAVTMIFALCCFNSAAVDLYLSQLEGLHQKDEQGAYDEILAMILENNPIETQQHLMPYSDVIDKFFSCTNCCISPTNDIPVFFEWPGEVVELAAFNYAKIHAFSRADDKPAENWEDLKNLTVGFKEGMKYGKNFEAMNLNSLAAVSIEENIEKLEKKIIDTFIAYVPDAYIVFKSLGMTPLPHAKNNPLEIHIERLVCRGVPKAFIEHFNARAYQLRRLGVFKHILKDNYIIRPLLMDH